MTFCAAHEQAGVKSFQQGLDPLVDESVEHQKGIAQGAPRKREKKTTYVVAPVKFLYRPRVPLECRPLHRFFLGSALDVPPFH